MAISTVVSAADSGVVFADAAYDLTEHLVKFSSSAATQGGSGGRGVYGCAEEIEAHLLG